MTQSGYVDSHVHLNLPDFQDTRDSLIRDLAESGCTYLLNVGIDIATSHQSIELAQRHPVVYSTAGIHPHDVSNIGPKEYDALKVLLGAEKVVAVGETGLDFYRNYSPKDRQEDAFRNQIRIAIEVQKPLVIHTRDAFPETHAILKEENAARVGGVMHCFSGDFEWARRFMDLGFYVSFACNSTYPKAEPLREAIRGVPHDRLLVETDSPYLPPQKSRNKRPNNPGNVMEVVRLAAELKGVYPEDICRSTVHNFETLFGLKRESDQGRLTYQVRNSLYLNMTAECTNECYFCARYYTGYLQGHSLKLSHAPSTEEIWKEIGDPTKYDEVVFCGYGEPTLRLDEIKELGRRLKEKGVITRLNTNGHGNRIHGKNILPELQGLIDRVSVSLNAETEEVYNEICLPLIDKAYTCVLEFIEESKKYIPEVTATVVDIPGKVNVEECRKIAERLGVKFRVRPYNILG